MSKFFSNISRAIGEGISEASTTTLAESQRQNEISKLEIKLKEIELKIEKNYTLIGQGVADILRKKEVVEQNFLESLFSPIQQLDLEKEQISEAIKEIKAKQADQLKAQELIQIKKEVETEIKKLKELKDLNVIDEDEFELAQAKLNKRIHNFEKLYNLKIAYERNLISHDDYIKKKSNLE